MIPSGTDDQSASRVGPQPGSREIPGCMAIAALAYAEAMTSSHLTSFAFFAAATAAAGAAYASRGSLLASGLFALLCAVLIGLGWRRRATRTSGLTDPSISTLVFPPESKFQPSVLPPR